MAGHHDSGVHTLLAERDRLVSSILGFRGGGGSHHETIKAVRDFLQCCGAGIPWVRMYQLFPSWQQQCGLLDQEWDRDAVLERAKVIFTLINPHGTTIRRTALGGRSWKGTGAETIGNQLVLTKLYYKREGANRPRDGFTAFEFHLPMNEQPRVAICVLHQTDYRHLIRDLREYIHEGYFPGGDQANNLQMVQRLGSYMIAPVVGGLLMDGLQFDQTINQASENETNYGQRSSVVPSVIPEPVSQSGLLEGVDDQILESFGYNNALPENSLMSLWPMTGYPYYMSMSVQYGHAPPRSSLSSLYNTRSMDGIAYHMAMLPEQDAPTDQVSMQNDSPSTLFEISMGMPNQNAMASENEKSQQDISTWGAHMVSPAQNCPQDENFPFLPFSEYNSNFETNDNEPSWLEPFSPSGYYSAATANNFPQDDSNLFPGFL